MQQVAASTRPAGLLVAKLTSMSEQRKTHTPDDIRNLIEQVDGQLREAEKLRSYANERHKRKDFFPERRKHPRIPTNGNPEDSRDRA